jgi:hypothetical protein
MKAEKLIDGSKDVGLEAHLRKLSMCFFLVTRMQGNIGT